MSTRTRRRRRESGSILPALPYIAVGAVAIVVAIVGAFALQPTTPVPENDGTEQRFVATTPPPITRPPVSAWIVGDSLTAGTGAPIGKGYAERMAHLLNWDLHVDAYGGSGYTGVGVQEPGATEIVDNSFPTRLDDLVEAAPDVVVIAGGRNDRYSQVDGVGPVARDYLESIREALPDTKIVVLSAFLWHTADEAVWADSTENLSAMLRPIASDVGGEFIDTHAEMSVVDDATRDDRSSDDGWHLNEVGYQVMGEELARALVAHGLPRGPERWKESGYQSNEWVEAESEILDQP